jgi:hypothetical protein
MVSFAYAQCPLTGKWWVSMNDATWIWSAPDEETAKAVAAEMNKRGFSLR